MIRIGRFVFDPKDIFAGEFADNEIVFRFRQDEDLKLTSKKGDPEYEPLVKIFNSFPEYK